MSLTSRAIDNITKRSSISILQQMGTLHSSGNQYSNTPANVTVTEQVALQQVAVYACVSLLTDALSTLPLDAYRKDGDSAKKVTPVPGLLRSPLEGMSLVDWLTRVYSSLIIRGNSYCLVVARDMNFRPTQLLPIHPDDVGARMSPEGRIIYNIAGHEYDQRDVIHTRGLTVPGSIVGLSPINYARNAIGLAATAETFGSQFFGQGATPSSTLETEQSLTDDQAQGLRDAWDNSHQGRRGTAVLTHGLKWKPISITPEESQFLETRQYQTNEIARLFRIPPHMIGEVDKTTSWGTGIAQQSAGFVRYTLTPWAIRLESSLSALLPQPQYVKANFEGLLRGTTLERYQGYAIAINNRFMAPNEVRAYEDMAPYEGGDEYLSPLNMAGTATGDVSGGNNDAADSGKETGNS
jgi:HK97 family phage portal protein